MMGVVARDTNYAGHLFRSPLEAKIVRFNN